MGPICKFADSKHARELMTEWKERLALHQWAIKLDLCDPHEFIMSNVAGECEWELIGKSAVIRILKPEHYGKRIMKYCAERILVHELLHCKLALFESDDTIYDRTMHMILEDMARALICAKYNISPEWFQDINYDNGEE